MTDPHVPLKPAVFEILLLLSEEDRHGYGLMQEMSDRTQGRWILGPGTLYRILKEMRDSGLIEQIEPKEVDLEAPPRTRRRTYRLTSQGRRVAASEARRMGALVARARSGSLIPPTEAF